MNPICVAPIFEYSRRVVSAFVLVALSAIFCSAQAEDSLTASFSLPNNVNAVRSICNTATIWSSQCSDFYRKGLVAVSSTSANQTQLSVFISSKSPVAKFTPTLDAMCGIPTGAFDVGNIEYSGNNEGFENAVIGLYGSCTTTSGGSVKYLKDWTSGTLGKVWQSTTNSKPTTLGVHLMGALYVIIGDDLGAVYACRRTVAVTGVRFACENAISYSSSGFKACNDYCSTEKGDKPEGCICGGGGAGEIQTNDYRPPVNGSSSSTTSISPTISDGTITFIAHFWNGVTSTLFGLNPDTKKNFFLAGLRQIKTFRVMDYDSDNLNDIVVAYNEVSVGTPAIKVFSGKGGFSKDNTYNKELSISSQSTTKTINGMDIIGGKIFFSVPGETGRTTTNGTMYYSTLDGNDIENSFSLNKSFSTFYWVRGCYATTSCNVPDLGIIDVTTSTAAFYPVKYLTSLSF